MALGGTMFHSSGNIGPQDTIHLSLPPFALRFEPTQDIIIDPKPRMCFGFFVRNHDPCMMPERLIQWIGGSIRPGVRLSPLPHRRELIQSETMYIAVFHLH